MSGASAQFAPQRTSEFYLTNAARWPICFMLSTNR
jgi:hypothetical protein